MTNHLTVRISGQVFHLVADRTPEYMERVAALADEKVREAGEHMKGNTFAAGVLATLNMADEAVRAEEEAKRAAARLADHTANTSHAEEVSAAQQERIRALEEQLLAAQEKLTEAEKQNEELRKKTEALTAQNVKLQRDAAHRRRK